MRKCKDCQEEKSESEFYTNNGTPMKDCKSCYQKKRKGYSKKWRDNNLIRQRQKEGEKRKLISPEERAKKAAYHKAYREKNKNKLHDASKQYREKHRDEINAKLRAYYAENKEIYSSKDKQRRKERGEEMNKREKENRKNNPEKGRLSYQRNKEKILLNRKKWGEKNKDKIKKYKRNAYLKIKLEQPQKYVLRSVRSVISHLGKGKKLRRSLEYIGVSDHFEFVSLLSLKTECPDWYLRKDYHIDHIWQVNWFDKMLSSAPIEEVSEKILHCLNHHSNLRPLLGIINLTRSCYDFSPLSKEDYLKYEPFLDERIKVGLKFYWENSHLFSGGTIEKGSKEESLVVNYIRSLEIES